MENGKIEQQKNDSQRAGVVLNLGGPTSNHLAASEIKIISAWAARYDELNGDAGARI